MSQQNADNEANVTKLPAEPDSVGEDMRAETGVRRADGDEQHELDAAVGNSDGVAGQPVEEPDDNTNVQFDDSEDNNSDVRVVFDFLGKQYSGSIGSRFKVIASNYHVSVHSSILKLDQVRLASGEHTIIGTPYITDACVWITAVAFGTNKILSFKKRRRKHSSATLRGQKQVIISYEIKDMRIPGLVSGPEVEPVARYRSVSN